MAKTIGKSLNKTPRDVRICYYLCSAVRYANIMRISMLTLVKKLNVEIVNKFEFVTLLLVVLKIKFDKDLQWVQMFWKLLNDY